MLRVGSTSLGLYGGQGREKGPLGVEEKEGVLGEGAGGGRVAGCGGLYRNWRGTELKQDWGCLTSA